METNEKGYEGEMIYRGRQNDVTLGMKLRKGGNETIRGGCHKRRRRALQGPESVMKGEEEDEMQ